MLQNIKLFYLLYKSVDIPSLIIYYLIIMKRTICVHSNLHIYNIIMLNQENQATNYIQISEFMCSCSSGLDHSIIIMTNHSVLEPKEGYEFVLFIRTGFLLYCLDSTQPAELPWKLSGRAPA